MYPRKLSYLLCFQSSCTLHSFRSSRTDYRVSSLTSCISLCTTLMISVNWMEYSKQHEAYPILLSYTETNQHLCYLYWLLPCPPYISLTLFWSYKTLLHIVSSLYSPENYDAVIRIHLFPNPSTTGLLWPPHIGLYTSIIFFFLSKCNVLSFIKKKKKTKPCNS